MNMKLSISAALIGGTFSFMAPVFAQVPIVRSQADHVATADGAVPLNRQGQTQAPAADPALLESLLFQLQDLQNLVSEQRGIIEELSYQMQVMQQEQKERYVDLDKRMQQLSERVSSAPAVGVPVADAQALTDEDILAEYEAAKALMLEKRFDESISQLAIFAKKYPDHPYAANAWYWIGEIYLVRRSTAEAKAAFERIVSDYNQHAKVPDSLYKLGVIAQQSSDQAAAKAYFERVITQYPNTQSAKLSQARLSSN